MRYRRRSQFISAKSSAVFMRVPTLTIRAGALALREIQQQIGQEKRAEVVHGQRALDTVGAEPPLREGAAGVVHQQVQMIETFAHRLSQGADR
jgi:hypothetical protein